MKISEGFWNIRRNNKRQIRVKNDDKEYGVKIEKGRGLVTWHGKKENQIRKSQKTAHKQK